MQAPALDDLRRQLRDIDQNLLLALDVRARFPRHPAPRWPEPEIRTPPPPLAEILLAISPAGTAADPSAPAAGNRGLIAALLARQRLAEAIADAKAALRPDDFRAALETGDREKLLALLTDLPAELRLLDFIRESAAELAPHLPNGLAPLLWREYVIPWTKQSEAARLLES
jgi:hypothetical protein